MKTIRVGGVPEHFNLPWHLAIADYNRSQTAFNLVWIDFPGGTGDMCKALRNEAIDAVVVLTEGILKDIDTGNPAKILQVYVDTPLIWGIHVAAGSKISSQEELVGKIAAISRVGSGSHLMVNVLADNLGWNTEGLKYEQVGNLDGGRTALKAGTADYFLWEKYTTKPLVDNGEFKRIGELPTPWPCFVIAANPEFSTWVDLANFMQLLEAKAQWVKTAPEAVQLLATNYGLQETDVIEWRKQTGWFGVRWTEKLEAEITTKLKKFRLIA